MANNEGSAYDIASAVRAGLLLRSIQERYHTVEIKAGPPSGLIVTAEFMKRVRRRLCGSMRTIAGLILFGGDIMGRSTKMNSITSPEKLAQVNPENMQLMREFLNYLRSVQRSETTIHGYENDIQIAWVWCLEQNGNKYFVDWTKRNIVAYQNWLLYNNENSPARVRRMKAALSSLANYVETVLDDEYPNFRNIINKIENPTNQPVREKTVLSEDDVKDLLCKLTDAKKYEVACFVALAAYGGRRKAEICRFRVDDFGDDKLVCGGSLWRSAPIKTKGRGNGKYLNCYTLAKPFRPYLEMWMEERERRGIESEWLFPNHDNPTQTLPLSTVNSWMETISRMAGKNIYAHAFRHFACTMLSNAGLPDDVIQELFGWSDISLVGVYRDRDTSETLEMYFDENGIKKREQKGLADL